MAATRRGNTMIQCRIKPAGLAWVDEYADKLNVSRSELLRLALSYAATTPAGFTKHARAQRDHHTE